MEFISANYFDTTTMASVDSGTLTVENLLFRDTKLQYTSVNFNDDATTASLTIDFGSTQTVSRIGIVGMNIKALTVFHSGNTANTLSLNTGAETTTSDWSTNSNTSMYLAFSTVQAQSITFDMKSTQVANSEKAIGYLHFGDTLLDFETYNRLPSAKDYKPKYVPKEITHKLSDGSIRNQFVDVKFQAKIKLKYITTDFRNDLYNFWTTQNEFAFVAFPTTTGWDEVLHPVVWPGSFDFFKFSDDSPGAGFSGQINLAEAT